MSKAVISLAVWSPFLLLALIFSLIFAFKGYKRGAARAGISVAATALSCLVSVIAARLIAAPTSGLLYPILEGMLPKIDGVDVADVIELARQLASAIAALLIYVPVFIIFSAVFKSVISVVFKKIIPDPKHVANRIGGLAVSVVDAVLLAILITLPLYGSLSLTGDVMNAVFEKPNGDTAMVLAATDPLIVDVAGLPPFSSAYDALLTCKIGGENVSISGVVREGADVVRDVRKLGNVKNGVNKDVAMSVLKGTERFLTENEFVTELVCTYMGDKLPTVKIPGVGSMELDEYYSGITDASQLRNDIPAVFDLAEAVVNSGLAEALSEKNPDVSGVDAKMISSAFGSTLNHSPALASFKGKVLNMVVDTLSKDIIDKGEDTDGSVAALRDAIAAIPTEPYGKSDADKEGEAVYLLLSGAISSQNKATNVKGLGMMLEGLARHPGVGVGKVVDAAGGLIATTGTEISPGLVNKIGENLEASVNKPIGESTFPNYCDTAVKAADAIGSIAGVGSGDNGGDGGETADNESLKELIVADKESLEAVKDTVSADLMVDLGIKPEQSETFKTVIDATFDAIIEADCTEEEAAKEAESLGNILGIVNDISNEPEKAEKIFEERTDEIIDQCLDSEVVQNVVTSLTEDGKSDPLNMFTELNNESKAMVEDKIDKYVSENPDSAEILESFKLFIGIN